MRPLTCKEGSRDALGRVGGLGAQMNGGDCGRDTQQRSAATSPKAKATAWRQCFVFLLSCQLRFRDESSGKNGEASEHACPWQRKMALVVTERGRHAGSQTPLGFSALGRLVPRFRGFDKCAEHYGVWKF